ncbi:MAG TPA: YbaB/EbfC family nucleoid-associated protein [Bacteroidia bacterium]|jgi:DNA-binding protein YbaB|nr:YbaB/EbfC family nucleoid-associated protein [Bacteroidia bacterium]
MFGKFSDMLGKLQEIKQKIAEIKAKMESTTTEVSGASGDIKMTINGNRKVQKIYISPALQSAGREELERQLLVTFNKAVEEADKMNEAEMKKVAGGMLPPGLF